MARLFLVSYILLKNIVKKERKKERKFAIQNQGCRQAGWQLVYRVAESREPRNRPLRTVSCYSVKNGCSKTVIFHHPIVYKCDICIVFTEHCTIFDLSKQ